MTVGNSMILDICRIRHEISLKYCEISLIVSRLFSISNVETLVRHPNIVAMVDGIYDGIVRTESRMISERFYFHCQFCCLHKTIQSMNATITRNRLSIVVSMIQKTVLSVLLIAPIHISGFGYSVSFVDRASLRSSFYCASRASFVDASFSTDGDVENAATLRSVTFSCLPKGEGSSFG